MRRFVLLLTVVLASLLTACNQAEKPLNVELDLPENGTAHLTYFYADECAACARVRDNVLSPIMNQCGTHIDLRLVDISTSEGYAVFLDTETYFIGEVGRWEIPTVATEDAYFIGEATIREKLQPELRCIFSAGGNAWPAIDSLLTHGQTVDDLADDPLNFSVGGEDNMESCVEDDAEICESPSPIFVLYLFDLDCDDACDRTLYDLRYLQGIFPDMQFEERDIVEHEKLVKDLLNEYGYDGVDASVTPAIVVGEDYLAGDDVTLSAMKNLLHEYAETGAQANWYLISVD